MPERIDSFSQEYRFLSNFWPVDVSLNMIKYPTVEHAYQAAKTHNRWERMDILACSTPGKAKRRGRKMTLRSDWEEVKITVMRRLLEQKFLPASVLAQMLLATGYAELVEGNPWGDKFWGVTDDGEGENHLGKLLMEIRDELSAQAGSGNCCCPGLRTTYLDDIRAPDPACPVHGDGGQR